MTRSFISLSKTSPLAIAVMIAMSTWMSPVAAFPSTALNSFTKSAAIATPVDNRLYRHCHVIGSRLRVVCMTADPWSPEHRELDRRAGRINHEGGPEKPRRAQPPRSHGTPC